MRRTLLEHLDRRARVGDQRAVGPRSTSFGASAIVVLVLDLADDLLDQILDGDEPVDAAELVDHQRHMRCATSRICSSRSSTGIDGATNSTLRAMLGSANVAAVDGAGAARP